MQIRQIQCYEPIPADSWYIVRTHKGGSKRKARRRWRRIHAHSAAAMLMFAPLFFLVWLIICMLDPASHLIPGILLLLILAAEAAAVITHLVSEVMLERFA